MAQIIADYVYFHMVYTLVKIDSNTIFNLEDFRPF